MSQIELTRHFCRAMSIQCYPKRKLKSFKFSGYLVLILIFWGGFSLNLQAAYLYKIDATNHINPTAYIWTLDNTQMSQHACSDYAANATAFSTVPCCSYYTCDGPIDYNHFAYTKYNSITEETTHGTRPVNYSRSPDDPASCTTLDPFNPATGLCDPNYTPPPPPLSPNKNLGSPPDCPSSFVASDKK